MIKCCLKICYQVLILLISVHQLQIGLAALGPNLGKAELINLLVVLSLATKQAALSSRQLSLHQLSR